MKKDQLYLSSINFLWGWGVEGGMFLDEIVNSIFIHTKKKKIFLDTGFIKKRIQLAEIFHYWVDLKLRTFLIHFCQPSLKENGDSFSLRWIFQLADESNVEEWGNGGWQGHSYQHHYDMNLSLKYPHPLPIFSQNNIFKKITHYQLHQKRNIAAKNQVIWCKMDWDRTLELYESRIII